MNKFLNKKLLIDTHCHFFNLDHTCDEMMKGFVSAMDIGNLSYANYETFREKYDAHLPKQADLIEKLTEKNPKKFLFGLE